MIVDLNRGRLPFNPCDPWLRIASTAALDALLFPCGWSEVQLYSLDIPEIPFTAKPGILPRLLPYEY